MITKKIFYLIWLFLITVNHLDAQVSENFSDGDFTTNPVWIGNASDWIVNSSKQLQSNNNIANSVFYISTENNLATSAQWEFFINLKFATSGANYVDVFLTASGSDLTKASGYFVRIGNTKDEICLYRTGNATPIIDGTDKIVTGSNNLIKIKVLRDEKNQWSLFRDMTGTGNNYVSEGSVTDATFTTSSYFGFLVKQSSISGFAKKHFFDDIVITPYVRDTIPPFIVSNKIVSSNAIDLQFNETLDSVSSQTVLNYQLNQPIEYPLSATLDPYNKSFVHLIFSNNFISKKENILTANGVSDLSANANDHVQTKFTIYIPQRYDIVIDEIMADPDPAVGLPSGKEWIELKNISGYPINIKGWALRDSNSYSGAFPDFVLMPDSFVIICSSNAVTALSVYGKTISISSFPSLNNEGKLLMLSNESGQIIHAVQYALTWYQNSIKSNGGWTLEMIDTRNTCSGISNWKASIDSKGGTPGNKNSVDAINPDQTQPQIMSAFAINDHTIELLFNEPLDSLNSADISNFKMSDDIGEPVSVTVAGPLFDKVLLHFNSSFAEKKIYTITVNGVKDCAGNEIKNHAKIRIGKTEPPQRFDIVVNEILFNPPSSGTDYVEIYNRSKKVIDLKDVYIANRNSHGNADNITIVNNQHQLLFPEDYCVLTKDPAIVKANYITQNPDAFVSVPKLPSFNDADGNVILMNVSEEIIDELCYSEKWHFALIKNKEGVALERINYDDTTLVRENQQRNWHSAASSLGYGTPTYKNSQSRIDENGNEQISVSPNVISPDNDGYEDFATIEYRFSDIGFVANITIYDGNGHPVRLLQRNSICGMKGNFKWDGLGENSKPLPNGIYIIFTEVFDLKGKKIQFKNIIVLARKN